MSSTGRSDVRHEDDFYESPSWAVRAVLPHLARAFAPTRLASLRILEPSAGRGAIVRVLIEAGADPLRIVAIEPNEERAAEARRLGVSVLCCTFEEAAARWTEHRPFDLVVKNSPFIHNEEHIRLARGLLLPGGTVAALCRLAFLAEGQDRARFRAAHPHDRLELVRRPSFTAEMLARLTDADLLAMATAEEQREVIAAMNRAAAAKRRGKARSREERLIAMVRARLSRTDSCAYAWGLFGEGRGGRFWTHEEAA